MMAYRRYGDTWAGRSIPIQASISFLRGFSKHDMIKMGNVIVGCLLTYALLCWVPPLDWNAAAMPPPEKRAAQMEPAEAPLVDWRLAKVEGSVDSIEGKIVSLGLEQRATRDAVLRQTQAFEMSEKNSTEDRADRRNRENIFGVILGGILTAKLSEAWKKRRAG